MKKLLFLAIAGSLALASCTDFDSSFDQSAQIKENAENVLGLIDPRQDWSNTTPGTITVTADASLKEIAKVQILTESPFFNDQAKVLAEADATKGETVTINYDAPKSSTRLIAACVDSKGHYFIKGFNVGDEALSFKKTANARTRGVTRAVNDLPDFSTVKMEYANSFQSFNAMRTILANDAAQPQGYLVKEWMDELVTTKKSDNLNLINWQNSNWENERMWRPTNKDNTNSSWKVVWNTVQATADPLSEEEKTELQDIFNNSLFRTDAADGWGRRDNMPFIREGNAVKFFNNHLVTDGSSPITLMPVQLASKEIYVCHLYYYYYKPSEVPAGMSETEYIKQLPKYKAIDMYRERDAYSKITGIGKDKEDETFLRLYQYLLPFYGDNAKFMPTKEQTSSFSTTDGKLYRIRNLSVKEGKNWYMTYTSTQNQKMKPLYADDAANVENQLWQIFTTNDGYTMLYNVGAKMFLTWSTNGGTRLINAYNEPRFIRYKFDDDSHIRCYNETWRSLNFNYNTSYTNGRELNNGSRNDDDKFKWALEEYQGPRNITAVTNVELDKYPTAYPEPTAKFEAGYRIGFVLRKEKDSSENNNTHLTNTQDGELYGNGALNTIINRFGQFVNSSSRYTMELDDPRVAMFNANGKTYLCFEDGSDAQYSDMILELGGVSTSQITKTEATEPDTQSTEEVITDDEGKGGSGVFMFDEQPEIPGLAYTMCFEDRPGEADYDMNDLVLRCIRHTNDRSLVQFSIVAIGAFDDLQIGGIEGKPAGKYDIDLMEDEVHVYFHAENLTGEDRFVNTLQGKGSDYTAISSWYRVDSILTIPQLLSKVYVINKTRNITITVPKTGEAPFALIIPGDFDYPREKQSITAAYSNFLMWVHDVNSYGRWTEFEQFENVVKNQFR